MQGQSVYGAGLFNFIVITSVICFDFYVAFGQCQDVQYEVLVDLFTATGGDNWKAKTGWEGEDCDVCSWYGISCNDAGKVEAIRLRNNRLSGNIPSSISALTELVVLDISSNRFNSNLPDAIGDLQKLELLDLSNSKFNGSIPASLGNLSSLKTLLLSGNSFTGDIPPVIGNLHALEVLEIFNTSLEGELPSSLGNLGSLTNLYIGLNNFHGGIPESLGDLSSLVSLEIVLENLSGPIPETLGNLSALRFLYIQHTNIDSVIPSSLGNLHALEELYLNNNLLSGNLPSSLGSLSSLYELYLTNNQLEGPIPESFGNMASLIRFYGYSNELEGPLPESLGNLTQLKVLDLGDNKISGNLPERMGSMSGLESLFLDQNNLEGPIPSTWSGLSQIQNMDISNNFLSGCIPEEAFNLCSIPYIVSEPNCFYLPFSSFCTGETCNSLIFTESGGDTFCAGENLIISTINDQFDYAWSTGHNGPQMEIQLSSDEEFTVTATNSYGCYFEESLYVHVLPSPETIIEEEICFGDLFFIDQTGYGSTGTYIHTLVAENGCDSTVYLKLTVFPEQEAFIEITICPGETIEINNHNYDEAGIYEIVLADENGCDSIITLDLSYYDKEVIHINETICQGEVYEYLGNRFFLEGVYTFEVETGDECPATVNLDLQVNPQSNVNIDTTICYGESLYFFDTYLSKAGTYTIPYENYYGCDSIVTLNLHIDELIEVEDEVFICEGDRYEFGSQLIENPGFYRHTFISQKGCDSTVLLMLQVIPSDTLAIDTLLCPGEIFSHLDKQYDSPGIYIQEVDTEGRCPLITRINLSYAEEKKTHIEARICAGSGYEFNGDLFFDPGSYESKLQGENGCDSTVILHLTVNPPDTVYVDTLLCAGETLNFSGVIYESPGDYDQLIIREDLCTIVALIHLEFREPIYRETIQSICEGDMWIVGYDTLISSGDYIIPLVSQNGCDSIVTVHLDVKDHHEIYSAKELCEGENIIIDGIVYDKTDTIAIQYADSFGCTVTEFIALEFRSNDQTKLSVSICSGESYTVGGQTFSASGNYLVMLPNSIGCDSIVSINLSVYPGYDTTIYAELCSGEVYDFMSHSFSQPGIYPIMLTSQYGCDSVVYLDLSETAKIIDTVYATICEGDVYLLEGEEYSVTGHYSLSRGDEDCQKETELFLQVEERPVLELQRNICPGYVLELYGQAFSDPGFYEFTVHSNTSSSCDTLVTLDLSAHEIITPVIESEKRACKGEEIQLRVSGYTGYSWFNGSTAPETTVTGSGTYGITVTDENNCTSMTETTVSFAELPAVTISGVTFPTSCNPENGGFTLHNDSTVLFSLDNGLNWQDNPVFSQLSAGTYYVLITDKDSLCQASLEDPVILENKESLVINDVQFSHNESCTDSVGWIEIDASTAEGNLIYSIDNGITWQSEPLFTSLPSGEYYIAAGIEGMTCIEYIEGSIALKDKNDIDFNIALTRELLCPGDLNAEVTFEFYGVEERPSVIWPDGHSGLQGTGLGAGLYTVTITSSGGCTKLASFEILEPEKIVYDKMLPSDTTLCSGEKLNLSFSDKNYDYSWYGPFGNMETGAEISVFESGTYKLEISDIRGCLVMDTFNVEVINEDFSGVDFLLSGEAAVGIPTVIVDVSWPQPDKFVWKYDQSSVNMLDSLLNQMIVAFQDTGTYMISMVATVGQCSNTISKYITVYEDQSQLSNQDGIFAFRKLIQDVLVFPNPNLGIFSLRTSLSQEASILVSIVNVSGNMVFQKAYHGQYLYAEMIDISHEPPGIYALIIQSGKEVRYLTFSKN